MSTKLHVGRMAVSCGLVRGGARGSLVISLMLCGVPSKPLQLQHPYYVEAGWAPRWVPYAPGFGVLVHLQRCLRSHVLLLLNRVLLLLDEVVYVVDDDSKEKKGRRFEMLQIKHVESVASRLAHIYAWRICATCSCARSSGCLA
ncbi:hypothetical protein Fmac_014812 [Flemingia macrophylla]|uniref:Secreted protein n=1 Tax=Flemingia macrophylla TaxID=520843 RepID=A0ABD1MCU1_9FABA